MPLPELISGESRLLVAAARNTGEPFDDDDRRGAEVLATLVAESMQRLRLLRELDDLATYDPLTGLLNRRAWHQRFEEMLTGLRGSRDATPVVLLFCDLDRFKEVNDRFGHAAGDAVLAVVGSRLARCLRPGDIAGRLGGDEFALAVQGSGDPLAAAITARVREALAEPVSVDGVSVGISTSIGAEVVDPSRLATVELLLGRADDAMYQAKRASL